MPSKPPPAAVPRANPFFLVFFFYTSHSPSFYFIFISRQVRLISFCPPQVRFAIRHFYSCNPASFSFLPVIATCPPLHFPVIYFPFFLPYIYFHHPFSSYPTSLTLYLCLIISNVLCPHPFLSSSFCVVTRSIVLPFSSIFFQSSPKFSCPNCAFRYPSRVLARNSSFIAERNAPFTQNAN